MKKLVSDQRNGWLKVNDYVLLYRRMILKLNCPKNYLQFYHFNITGPLKEIVPKRIQQKENTNIKLF